MDANGSGLNRGLIPVLFFFAAALVISSAPNPFKSIEIAA